jgi:hypothetical protein
MAGRGPAPAGAHTRKSNDHQTIKLIADKKLRGPSLPKLVTKTGAVEAWHPQTVKWWNHWRRSPQAIRMMTGPDWDFLLDTALMHHEMWKNRKWELAAEIRLRVQKFGATPEDRSRLRVEIGTGMPDTGGSSAPDAAPVASLDEQRWKRIAGDD